MRQAIAILDSGVGGLTVAREVMRQLPKESIIYFGDTARAPYGPRAVEEVKKFTKQIVAYLLKFRPKMIVIACNTATAIALEDIRGMVDIPVIGVVYPGARAAIKNTKNGCIGVIGTENTIRSGAYEQALLSIAPHLSVTSLACPSLVPVVESRMFRTGLARQVVRESLGPLVGSPIDCLILGCTHYPFLAGAIADVIGPEVAMISSADETAREISAVLYHNRQLEKSEGAPMHRFFCSGNAAAFQATAREWLNEQMKVAPVLWQMTDLSG